MERLYFHVVREGSGWRVRVSRGDGDQCFDRLKDAVDSAIRAARMQWEVLGRPTGVRLELPNGLCAEEWTYGGHGFGSR